MILIILWHNHLKKYSINLFSNICSVVLHEWFFYYLFVHTNFFLFFQTFDVLPNESGDPSRPSMSDRPKKSGPVLEQGVSGSKPKSFVDL